MLELLTLPFFQRALLVGIILGVLMALLGVFVVLRRLSFFADAFAHSALTGIALGILLSINPFLAALVFVLLLAGGVTYLQRTSKLPVDTLLGVLFPVAVSIGVIVVYITPGYQTNLLAYLFGDILTVSTFDVVISVALSAIVTGLLLVNGKAQVTIAVDSSLAHAEGVAVTRQELLLMVLLAAVIALSIKLVGIVLVTAMLVIPAATAQNLAWSLSSMFAISAASSIVAVIAGMLISALLGLPSGPAIVLAAGCCFVLSLIFHRRQ